MFISALFFEPIKPIRKRLKLERNKINGFDLNLKRDLSLNQSGEWSLVWGVAVWKLWKWRNSLIFEEGFQKPENPSEIVLRSWKHFTVKQEGTDCIQPVFVRNAGWSSAEHEYVRVRVDGAVTSLQGRAGCGGLIQSREGRWIAGFSHFLGSCNAFEAEQWAMLKGLDLAWDLGFRRVLLQSDAKELISLLENDEADRYANLLYWRIKEFLSRSWELCLSFIPREANKAADVLAKRGLSNSEFYDVCPGFLHTVLSHESLGSDPLCL